MKIEDKVRNLLVTQLAVKPEAVVGTANLREDLGADSLDAIEIVMTLEEEYGIDIADQDAERLETVDDVVRYLRKVTGGE